jgi:hypothetical protein
VPDLSFWFLKPRFPQLTFFTVAALANLMRKVGLFTFNS